MFSRLFDIKVSVKKSSLPLCNIVVFLQHHVYINESSLGFLPDAGMVTLANVMSPFSLCSSNRQPLARGALSK